MSQSVDCVSSILACLPDQSQNASRLLFTSMVTIAKGLEYLIFRISFKNFDFFFEKLLLSLLKTYQKKQSIIYSSIMIRLVVDIFFSIFIIFIL